MLNLATLRTPGVYIDEISKFPPSIAPVETAIPIFIGYTAEVVYKGKSYLNKPLRVDSLIEFEQYFGGAPKLNVVSVDLDQNNAVVNADVRATYYLFDSLRLYFSNGGGKCYIFSIGQYPDVFDAADFSSSVGNALLELAKEDEPTLIVFPDGILLDPADLGALQSLALAQCEANKDRFLVADVKIADTSTDTYEQTDITAFKTAIGMGDLQFGAAYYPYVRVNLPREIRYRDIRNKVRKLGSLVNWTGPEFVLPTDLETLTLFQEFDDTVASAGLLELQVQTFLTDKATADIQTGHQTRKQAFLSAVSAAAIDAYSVATTDAVKAAFTELIDYQFALVHRFMDQLAKTGTGLAGPLLIDYRQRLVDSVLPGVVVPLVNIDLLAEENTSPKLATIRNAGGRAWQFENAPAPGNTWQLAFNTAAPLPVADPSGFVFIPIPAADSAALKREKTVKNLTELVTKAADTVYASIASVITKLLSDVRQMELAREQGIVRRIPVLGNTLSFLSRENFVLPPSGAIAGVYARVDGSRGVWKAPANESLRNVVAPLVRLTEVEHGELNVDPGLGKSINAIRHYTGKGTLVFGARTLAGNSNEWRYVNVRRFFNMVEESCKKATEQFVFEPNDANTWVKVQAMIENFLTVQWRQGALQGATTEQAFYVAVGLGKTMTALDVLEGRMIVEIGMAVVRPAEFIILQFSHKLPEA